MNNQGNVDWLSIYGAFTSTVALIISIVLAVREIVRDKRKIVVICEEALRLNIYDSEFSAKAILISDPAVTAIEEMQFELPIAFAIRAVNSGHRPVCIIEFGFRLSNGGFIRLSDEISGLQSMGDERLSEYLPKIIADGERVSAGFTIEAILDAIRLYQDDTLSITDVYVQDVEGTKYYGQLPQAVLIQSHSNR